MDLIQEQEKPMMRFVSIADVLLDANGILAGVLGGGIRGWVLRVCAEA